MVVDDAKDATFVSVGREPNGIPAQVMHLGGGPTRLLELMRRRVALHRGKRESRAGINS